jgi:UDP-N-acetyl-D-mannosaminuronate dehydrogenase
LSPGDPSGVSRTLQASVHVFAVKTTRCNRAAAEEGNTFKSADLSAKTLAEADVVVLTTNHSAFDINFIKENARLIVDMRNMIKENSEKVYKL